MLPSSSCALAFDSYIRLCDTITIKLNQKSTNLSILNKKKRLNGNCIRNGTDGDKVERSVSHVISVTSIINR